MQGSTFPAWHDAFHILGQTAVAQDDITQTASRLHSVTHSKMVYMTEDRTSGKPVCRLLCAQASFVILRSSVNFFSSS